MILSYSGVRRDLVVDIFAIPNYYLVDGSGVRKFYFGYIHGISRKMRIKGKLNWAFLHLFSNDPLAFSRCPDYQNLKSRFLVPDPTRMIFTRKTVLKRLAPLVTTNIIRFGM